MPTFGTRLRFYRFGWADSTDLKGRQLLMMRHIRLQRDLAFEALQLVHTLCRDRECMERQLALDEQLAVRLALDADAFDPDQGDPEVYDGDGLSAVHMRCRTSRVCDRTVT